MQHKRRTTAGTCNFGVATGGGVIAGLLTGTILVFCLAALAYRTANPAAALLPMGLTALGISSVVCGRVSCMMWGNRSLIPTLAAGAIFTLLIAAGGLCIPGSTLTFWIRIAGCPSIFVLALAGGAVGRKSNKRRSRRP